MIRHGQHSDGVRLLLSPNCSLSWRDNVRIWIALCTLSAIIVTGMVWAGAWLVFPFAGLELGALGGAFYYTARQCRKQEVLIISSDRLHLEKGLYRKQHEWSLPRPYTRVRLTTAAHPFTPPKLSLQHRDTNVPFAEFLNSDDTEALVSLLEQHGVRIEAQTPSADIWF